MHAYLTQVYKLFKECVVIILFKLILSQECQLVIFVDSDAIFTNFSMKVKTLFDLFQAKDKQMFVTVPSLDRYINAGVTLMHNSDDARALLLAAMDEQQWSTNWRTTWGFEQSAMWELIRPPNSRWKSIINISEDDHTLQGLCGFSNGCCLWKPGDFIIHFAAAASKAIEIAKFIKDHPKLFVPPKTRLSQMHCFSSVVILYNIFGATLCCNINLAVTKLLFH